MYGDGSRFERLRYVELLWAVLKREAPVLGVFVFVVVAVVCVVCFFLTTFYFPLLTSKLLDSLESQIQKAALMDGTGTTHDERVVQHKVGGDWSD